MKPSYSSVVAKPSFLDFPALPSRSMGSSDDRSQGTSSPCSYTTNLNDDSFSTDSDSKLNEMVANLCDVAEDDDGREAVKKSVKTVTKPKCDFKNLCSFDSPPKEDESRSSSQLSDNASQLEYTKLFEMIQHQLAVAGKKKCQKCQKNKPAKQEPAKDPPIVSQQEPQSQPSANIPTIPAPTSTDNTIIVVVLILLISIIFYKL